MLNMATAVEDHQPQAAPRRAFPTSHPARERLGYKSDPESALPELPPSPPTEHQHGANAAPPVDAEPRLAVLERIPTYLQPNLPWRDRLLHFTFAWYTVTMSTSGISLILATTPHRFRGLDEIGLAVFCFDLLSFLGITAAILLRFALYRHTFRRAFTRPAEALFISTFFLSVAAILSNMDQYARLFLSAAQRARMAEGFLRVAFWCYLGASFAFSVGQYHLLFTVKKERRLMVSAMTPAWILPIFPVMLAGTLAGVCARGLAAEQALAVLCAGLAAQGLGFLVSVFFYSTYLSRLMAFGLPAQRPGMFIAVGPPSFTCAALVAMAAEVPRVLDELAGDSSAVRVGVLAALGEVDVPTLAMGFRLLALSAAVFLWGLSFWFFASATLAVVAGMPDRKFHLSWWSFVFPNVGFTLASMRMGDALGSGGILWLSTVMTALLFLAWAFIVFRCLRAVYRREIVWPGHDEDSD
ncbi:hypothetical protein BT67DRAFT_92166 [Trichocladium antarcticum]|uniref:Malic acid transport protein n=1 Tax=Trichocladium antarcticum TaxID=1450529 RepID=A0AAN6UIA5_9PEZI|nr:hypothetical protein BT67DRAFT_92166 [Trichocladium antarcticum]